MKIFRRHVLLEGLSEGHATIAAHPLRASLAALAMAAAVMTTAVVQTGLDALARTARETSARAFGSDSFVLTRVASGNVSRRELALKLERNPNITRSDVRFVDSYAGDRLVYAAIAQRTADVSAAGRKFENALINGAQAALFDIRDVGIDRGRPFTKDDDARGAQVVVLGRAVVDTLFPVGDPLGQPVRIANRAFRIVGVLQQQGTSGGVSLDRYVWMPLTAYERAFGAPASLQVFARAVDVSRTTAAEDHATISMRARRHLQPGAADNFDIVTPEASRNFVSAITQRLGAAGPPISLMALLAAFVVVTNTTLVSVTPRTREIGIRRAIGAARVNVLVETMAESILITIAGVAVGLLAAVALLSFASWTSGVAVNLAWSTALMSLGEAVLAGLAAGWYPTRRAVRLEVINALRQES
ncbi:MAG TPA: ABC transporter permease [Gemmatimonadaceae bacterium]|nr:ABC transporter permease [Gemmatimonadaceae bacterium]